MSLQTDLGDLSAVGNCSKNSDVQFIPLSSVGISALNEIENVFLVVCLMQTVPLFIL